MYRVDRSVRVPYSARQMYDLVADVPSYPRFLPWCSGAQLKHRPDGALEARLDIDYLGVRSHFTTCNRQSAPQSIDMELLDGPFKRLDGHWRFRALPARGCTVQLQLRYQFAAGLLGRMFQPVFERIASSQIDAFTQRAEALYGAV
jgi:ribosome-associated toxin RatA of RatAB toxin-antitoxin module